MKIEEKDLQITKEAYFKFFNSFYGSGMRFKRSFEAVEKLCEEKGYQSYYSSFESFKTAFYTKK